MKIFILSIIASLLLQVNAHAYDDFAYSSRSIQRRDENETEITTPKIYGRDLLGWGVDLRIARPEESLKTPLFLFEYSEMVDDNTYIYPLSPEIQFHVPDQVYVRTIAEQFANSRIFTRVDLYIKQLNLELGLSIEASKENSNSSTESTDGEPNLSTFSGDVEVTYNARNLNNQTKVLTTNSLEYALWQLVISPDQVVRSKVQTRIDFTAQANNDSVYYEFFDRQGTHYIESVIVGGKLEMSNLVNTSFDEDTDKIAAAASLTFKKAFGLDSFSANASIDYTTTITTFEQETQMTMKAYGGDPDVSSFFGGAVDASATFVAWQKSVISNPAVIRYRLRDVTWLFPYSIRPDAREALRKYLKGQLQP